MSLVVKLRYILKLLSAASWVVILPVTYAYTWKNPTGLARAIKSWLGDGQNQPSLYILAVVIYLAPNLLSATLFLFPVIRRALERSNLKVVTFIMWWSQVVLINLKLIQPRLFVGRGMHEGAFSLFKYTMFWVLLLATKLVVSFYVEIKPLVQPTKDIMKEPIRTFKWHEFFPHANNNIGVVIALWAPIILVYFMDTQIWYAIFSTLIGGVYGACRRLGETSEDTREQEKIAARFAQIWNLIITSFREEDLIDDREKDLLLVPYCKDRDMDIIQWPPFLLASKIPIALDMAADSGGKDRDLKKRMKSDPYFTYAIKECYASFKNIIYELVIDSRERGYIQKIFDAVDEHIAEETLIKELNMSNLPTLSKKFIELLDLLIKRLRLLLTVKESAMDVPTNLDARRRISFFANSLFMSMPDAPKVRQMLPFSVLTPYYKEDVLFSSQALAEQNEDGVSILFYLQKIYPDEWKNFLERVHCESEDQLHETEHSEEQLRLWASYRGQTLTRTVRGMMYYRQALVLQASLDMARDDDLMEGFRAADLLSESDESPLLTQCKAIADMKFTYVVSCQQYGIQKRSGDPHAQDILRLMTT
ncbi:Callose synthase 3 [Zea mays]|uniref:Callose synthase 3 n=1 Tax=Zea mays TaxID=4577 RepID=A0A1D6HQB8_MAIZE|nr:Callose synthase 3 [Zea mays]AQK76465.1 Callose synthase 3 [Zea mays]AQK76468.1 Callose synthase 3 [Zea mays]AQK76469.1 Callose synthase 3 [Zea mays]